MIATFVLNTRSSRYYRFSRLAGGLAMIVISYNGLGKGHWRKTIAVYFAAVHRTWRRHIEGEDDTAAECPP
jgi:hypothetical protein